MPLLQEMTSHAMRKQQLEQEVQQRDAHIQQLQQQLQAAAQHAQRAQQQHELQVLRTYRAAAAKSAEHLQGLKDRYFHTVPVGPAANQGRKQGPGSVLKMQRRDIAAAYAEFQQVRGSIQSMPSMPATPSSSSKRGMWAEGGFTSIKQPLRQDSGQSPMVSELFLLPAASDPSAAHSFALRSINRAASSSPQRRGSPEQTFSPKQTLSHLASSHNRHDAAEHADSVPNSPQAGFSKQPHLSWLTLPQAEISNVSVETSAAGSDSNAAVPSDVHFGSTVADGQPPPNWQLPFLQQLVQFEACLLTALMGLLTQQPAKRHDENVSEESKPDPTRQQSWPKSASRETADDTTGKSYSADMIMIIVICCLCK